MNSLKPCHQVRRAGSRTGFDSHGSDENEAIDLVRKMFQHVGVPEVFIDRYPFELSGGMRQRVAIAHGAGNSPN